MAYLDIVLPFAARVGLLDFHFAGEVFRGVAAFGTGKLRYWALEDDFAAEASGIGAYVDDEVGGTHDFLVMLDHNDRVAELLQLPQHTDETVGVARMQSD